MKCPKCKKELGSVEEVAGEFVRCPFCGAEIEEKVRVLLQKKGKKTIGSSDIPPIPGSKRKGASEHPSVAMGIGFWMVFAGCLGWGLTGSAVVLRLFEPGFTPIKEGAFLFFGALACLGLGVRILRKGSTLAESGLSLALIALGSSAICLGHVLGRGLMALSLGQSFAVAGDEIVLGVLLAGVGLAVGWKSIRRHGWALRAIGLGILSLFMISVIYFTPNVISSFSERPAFGFRLLFPNLLPFIALIVSCVGLACRIKRWQSDSKSTTSATLLDICWFALGVVSVIWIILQTRQLSGRNCSIGILVLPLATVSVVLGLLPLTVKGVYRAWSDNPGLRHDIMAAAEFFWKVLPFVLLTLPIAWLSGNRTAMIVDEGLICVGTMFGVLIWWFGRKTVQNDKGQMSEYGGWVARWGLLLSGAMAILFLSGCSVMLRILGGQSASSVFDSPAGVMVWCALTFIAAETAFGMIWLWFVHRSALADYNDSTMVCRVGAAGCMAFLFLALTYLLTAGSGRQSFASAITELFAGLRGSLFIRGTWADGIVNGIFSGLRRLAGFFAGSWPLVLLVYLVLLIHFLALQRVRWARIVTGIVWFVPGVGFFLFVLLGVIQVCSTLGLANGGRRTSTGWGLALLAGGIVVFVRFVGGVWELLTRSAEDLKAGRKDAGAGAFQLVVDVSMVLLSAIFVFGLTFVFGGHSDAALFQLHTIVTGLFSGLIIWVEQSRFLLLQWQGFLVALALTGWGILFINDELRRCRVSMYPWAVLLWTAGMVVYGRVCWRTTQSYSWPIPPGANLILGIIFVLGAALAVTVVTLFIRWWGLRQRLAEEPALVEEDCRVTGVCSGLGRLGLLGLLALGVFFVSISVTHLESAFGRQISAGFNRAWYGFAFIVERVRVWVMSGGSSGIVLLLVSLGCLGVLFLQYIGQFRSWSIRIAAAGVWTAGGVVLLVFAGRFLRIGLGGSLRIEEAFTVALALSLGGPLLYAVASSWVWLLRGE